jgi:hypothetical protein
VIIGIAHINRKKGQPGQCKVCKGTIGVGEVHAVIVVRYGKGQEAIFKLRAAQGKAWTKKSGLKYSRLHLKNCLSIWFIAVYSRRTEARRERKGGRPPLPAMSPEESLLRRRLIRKRADIIRQIITTDDNARVTVLADRLLRIQSELKVPLTPHHEKNRHRSMILSQAQRKINKAKEAIGGGT